MPISMKICAIIVAAGRGTRAGGGTPKQYRTLAGRSVLTHTVNAFDTHPDVDDVLVVIHPDDRELAERAAPDKVLISGAETRAGSVLAGLLGVPSGTTHVLIHDAARPCVSARIISDVVSALGQSDAAAPGLVVTDALWSVEDAKISDTRDRSGLMRAQTPQGFALSTILAAHQNGSEKAADDVELALKAGVEVMAVIGEEANLKITTGEDFDRAAKILEQNMDVRIGTGFDVHAFTEGNSVVLCGVEIAHDATLSGHSDADVAMHAITDAIYGALADGDIGQHFPPSDPQWKGAASEIFLRHAVDLAKSRGFRIGNLDCTIMCETPKIGPHSAVMRQRLADITGLEIERVSVKATTTEKLGFTGRKEGIAAQAAATLIRT